VSDKSAPDNDVRLLIYQRFAAEGRPPMAIEIATAMGLSPLEVEASFRRLADGHVIVLAPGTHQIWMANPFSALPSPFAVRARNRDYFGSCIWDALGVIAMLGGEGEVATRCPDCGAEMSLSVTAGDVGPEDYVVHYAIPAARWWDDIGDT
jgi:hypothetical protein